MAMLREKRVAPVKFISTVTLGDEGVSWLWGVDRTSHLQLQEQASRPFRAEEAALDFISGMTLPESVAWGEHPIVDDLLHRYVRNVKRQDSCLAQKQKTVNIQQPITIAALNHTQTRSKPSPDAVARKAYFSYLNEGSAPGQDARHWLEAEAQLFADIDREMKIFPR